LAKPQERKRHPANAGQGLQAKGEGSNRVVKQFPSRRQEPKRKPHYESNQVTDEQAAHCYHCCFEQRSVGSSALQITYDLLGGWQQHWRPNFCAIRCFPKQNETSKKCGRQEKSFHLAAIASA
jgi:hypothetical protein